MTSYQKTKAGIQSHFPLLLHSSIHYVSSLCYGKLLGNDKLVVVNKLPQLAPCFFLRQTSPVSRQTCASTVFRHLGLVLLFTSFELKLRGNDKLVVVSKLQQLAPCFPSLRYGKLRAWVVKVSSKLGLFFQQTSVSMMLCKHTFLIHSFSNI